MKKQRRILSVVLILLLLLSLLVPMVAHATEVNDGYGNEWVYDEARVISAETEAYIKSLNEEVFANYANKPQLAFIILNDLPYNMDDYKLDMFNEYGVGTKVENHGMLFVFAINDREYGLEIGDGFVKGSILRKELETDFITEEMKNSLRAENYDIVIYQVAEHLAGMMADEENLAYAQKEEAAATKRAETEATADINCERRKKSARWVTGGLLAIYVIGSGSAFINMFFADRKKEKQYREIEQKYARHFALLGEQEETARNVMRQKMMDKARGCDDTSCFANDFAKNLHALYLTYQESLLREMGCRERYSKYVNELERRNNFNAFIQYRLVSLSTIVKDVDLEEDDKLATKAENKQRVESFWNANKARVQNQAIIDALRCTFEHFVVDNRLISKAELERHFVKEMNALNFKYECDRFCEENANLIKAHDFSRSQFYQELASSTQGKQYRYSPSYNNFWMRHCLISHMNTQKRLREQREEQERRRARQHRAAAQRRTQRSRNSSFGTGFRGGFSSGGGFRGGW